jgi:dipeptidyl-peptidase 4
MSVARMWRASIRPALIFALAFSSTLGAQSAAPADPRLLTVPRIFSGEFSGQYPPGTRWLDDSTYTLVQPSQSGRGAELVRVDAASGAARVIVGAAELTPAGGEPLDIEDYVWSADYRKLLIFTNSSRVWRANTRGDYWVFDLGTKRLRKLGGASAKPSTLMFAKFSPDGNRVGYVREHDIYVERVAGGDPVRLTRDGSTTTINGTFDWVYEEELGMRDGFRWSPDGTRIAFWQLDAKGVRDFLLINNTDSLYSFTVPVQYPKAGTTNSAARIGTVSSAGGPITWMNVPGDPRNNYLARMDWAANANELTIEQLNRRQTTNTFWIANAKTGAVRTLFVERDSAWIDIYDDNSDWGPGPSLHWLQDGSAFVYLTERDGWRHAYLVSRDGKTKLITKGPYDVMKVVQVDAASGWLYFNASPTDATTMYLWRIRLDGSGAPERLTPADQKGTHDYDLAPHAKWAIHTSSSWGTPPTVELVRLPTHTPVRTMADNARLKSRLGQLAQGGAEFFKVPLSKGSESFDLDAWIMKPANFDSTKKYPILFYVYGEPASQTVTNSYGGSRWLWHLMLTQQGYIVASVDNRGTPGPKGRAWRKALRNHMGALRVDDQSMAARAIARRPYVDSMRIAIWGWSGGGSSTLHTMFRAPDVYKVGMAVAPVTDVHFYDTIYQERYVGLPTDDSAAYYDASAINFVSGLRGKLLVVHGSGDDNVHFQNTEKLINALVAAGKPFNMMEYPNRTHGIYEGPGTTVHLFSLLTRYLEENMPH